MISSQKLLEVYSPKNCLTNSFKIKNVSDAINSKAPTLGSIRREKGAEFTQSLIMAWLVYLNNLLDLKNPMPQAQIELCSQDVLNEFNALKMSDLTLVFKRVISGENGKFYERLSISDVLTFFRDYFNERCDVAERETLRIHYDIKSDQTFSESKNIKRILMDKR